MDPSYSASFKSVDAADFYSNKVYSSNSYDSFIWKIQSAKLRTFFESFPVKVGGLSHLDFACGTGRILEYFQGFVGHSTGVDISGEMLDVARKEVSNVKFILGDLINNNELCRSKFDLITAFRFFLNAEPPLRSKAIKVLRSRLEERNGRLIFNIHGNKHSLRHFSILLRGKNSKERVNEMTLKQVKRLVVEAGLEIEHWYGSGIIPPFFYKTKFRGPIKFLDAFLSNIPFLKSICYDLLFICKVKNSNEHALPADHVEINRRSLTRRKQAKALM